MKIEFDPNKNQKNITERDLPFELVRDFEFETARYLIDDRADYGETRIRALGVLAGRVYALVFTEIPGGIRVISFRKANKREVAEYEKSKTA
jgi:uncharacterized DUF497 family protein